ncbi:MAG TPA: glucose-6-phosphate isomerase family protein [Chloroflexota bacterium]|nr:glucose-6-phosphate isomerase family protein [Chloroflexota bacterium]
MIDLTPMAGLDLRLDPARLALEFGPEIAHPASETRTLAQVLPMMADGRGAGPDHLYTVYMDLYMREDRQALHEQGLLYGAVLYNHGVIGRERLRSQGHIHSEKPGTGLRYSEVYEFWTGRGYVFLQKESAPEVTRAYLVRVRAGDKLVIPFGWVHLVVTDGDEGLSFGAWCARANTLEYARLQALGGPCYYFLADATLEVNPRYARVPPVIRAEARDLPSLGIPVDRPIYTSWKENPALYRFLAEPGTIGDVWGAL